MSDSDEIDCSWRKYYLYDDNERQKRCYCLSCGNSYYENKNENCKCGYFCLNCFKDWILLFRNGDADYGDYGDYADYAYYGVPCMECGQLLPEKLIEKHVNPNRQMKQINIEKNFFDRVNNLLILTSTNPFDKICLVQSLISASGFSRNQILNYDGERLNLDRIIRDFLDRRSDDIKMIVINECEISASEEDKFASFVNDKTRKKIIITNCERITNHSNFNVKYPIKYDGAFLMRNATKILSNLVRFIRLTSLNKDVIERYVENNSTVVYGDIGQKFSTSTDWLDYFYVYDISADNKRGRSNEDDQTRTIKRGRSNEDDTDN